MNIAVRLLANDFKAFNISASVVLSSALVASSHRLRSQMTQKYSIKIEVTSETNIYSVSSNSEDLHDNYSQNLKQ